MLAAELTARHHPVSHTKVTQLLREDGYSLQGNRKTEEGGDHPDRDAHSGISTAPSNRLYGRVSPSFPWTRRRKN
jgi:hypothetical protein